MTYTVSVTRPGRGRYTGGAYVTSETFRDEKRAKDYYTDMLLKYPDYKVEFLTSEK
jgi:hypothetical protein